MDDGRQMNGWEKGWMNKKSVTGPEVHDKYCLLFISLFLFSTSVPLVTYYSGNSNQNAALNNALKLI